MKYSAALFLLLLLALSAFAQKTNTTKKPVNSTKTTVEKLGTEKEEFDKAVALANPLERIAALQKFIKNFPKSAEKTRALELIVSARGQIGDDKLKAGETESGIAFFKAAVQDAPTPISEELFTNLLLQFPTNLLLRGKADAANEIAKMIEDKIGENPKYLLGLATFYIGTENGAEAQRLAEKAIAAENALAEKPEKSNLPAAYQTLGLANRFNFDFEASANAYAKALELDAASMVSRRGLAEMKRALGKPDEAVALYKEILTVNETDLAAKNGLILALFDAGKRAEAEAEMAKTLEIAPKNWFLLVGAAYWYAAHGEGAKAVDLAQKAIDIEPRYSWSYIALARGQMAQKQPLEAEKTLLKARQYGDFPTLDYELATARAQAGFFREAAETLKRLFYVKNDYVKAWMGNRIPLEAKSFLELLAVERRASIFEPSSADNSENAERLKNLLELAQKFDAPDATDTEIVDLTDRFVAGEDNMKLHRLLFVARQLLDKKKALPKVLELTQAAIGKVDSALDVATPAAAVLADELYPNRMYAFSRGEILIVPNITRPTLSKILRSEIEQISGWALYQQNKAGEAVVRLKRALTVVPEKSTWSRLTMWRLGAALDAEGKPAEALDYYIRSYTEGEPDAGKYLIIEALYQKINGNTDGLNEKIGAKPTAVAAVNPNNQTVAQTETKTTETKPEVNPLAAPSPTPTETPQTVAETKVQETPSPSPIAENTAKVEPSPSPAEVKTDAAKTDEPNKNAESSNTTKPLFEPIIITIPKPDTSKTNSGETRSRRITENKTEEIEPCTLVVSEENISILNGGGSLGILVSFEKEGDLKQIKATSSSPQDVEVAAEPEIGEASGKAFFLVKSISTNKGAFTITFDAPCGKKEILVKVR
jgi:tetratricopeptide (TPR) repeat protein